MIQIITIFLFQRKAVDNIKIHVKSVSDPEVVESVSTGH